MRVRTASLGLVLALGCTATSTGSGSAGGSRREAGPAAATSEASRDTAEAAASAAPSELSEAEREAADEWLARYRAGEVAMSTEDPAVKFVATPDDPCRPMPAERPADFEFSYWQDPYEDVIEIDFGLAGVDLGACHFEWDMIWLDPPAGSCALLDEAELDALYAELRALEPWTIETKPMKPVPHTVGVGVGLRWSGSRCHIEDIHGVSEIRPRDEERFAAVVAAFRRAYSAAQEREAQREEPRAEP